MNAKTLTLMIAALVCLPATAAAQDNGAWRGQDNEFGSIRTPYTVDVNGERAAVEAKVILRKNYDDKQATFFMFAWTVENTPLDVTFDNLVRADTGQELPCTQRQGDGRSQLKCFVDRADMPAAGTEIVMRGTVGSSRVGTFQVGAIVVPFTYIWMRVPQSNGLDAELYGYTMVNVQQATGGGGNRLGGLGNDVPGAGALAVVAASVVAVGVLALRRRRA